MTTYTNQETGAQMTVFVHEVFEQHGDKWARVNKGANKTPMTFNVRATALDMVIV